MNRILSGSTKMIEGVKDEFGKDLVFWGGGCDTQQTLDSATPTQITADVKKRIKVLSPGGGFVFQQIHNIMAKELYLTKLLVRYILLLKVR